MAQNYTFNGSLSMTASSATGFTSSASQSFTLNITGVDQIASGRIDVATDGDATITIRRKSSGFFIDGQKMVKDDVAAALAKIILRSVYVKSEEDMMDYIDAGKTRKINFYRSRR